MILWQRTSVELGPITTGGFVLFKPGNTIEVFALDGVVPTDAWHEVDVRGSKKVFLDWAFTVEAVTQSISTLAQSYGLRGHVLGWFQETGFAPARQPAATRTTLDWDAAQTQLDDDLLGFTTKTVSVSGAFKYLNIAGGASGLTISNRFLGNITTAPTVGSYYTGFVELSHRTLNDDSTTVVAGYESTIAGHESVWACLGYTVPTFTLGTFDSLVVTGRISLHGA